ncbi:MULTISPECIES: hypothetical protein [Bacillus]|uniref:hypothetical protein n=1 Tax=Bacillus TaxID=1386 RepID=UPI0006267F33|nr:MULTISPECIES: hypothetical protein [Bacillus]KKK10353.1 hypothetical protein UF15_07605 [Bacillus sp. L_1B0_12]KOA78016.1 hypothetical protein ACR53_10670 [Bacillus stratosphericus]MDF9417495.1 hypothetical protein [Bacillus altitudinis]MDT1122063.1 hypothetical protein [Bacillus altitudinis]
MKFMELTKPNDEKVTVNFNAILSFGVNPHDETGCRIAADGTHFINVVESYDYVKQMIRRLGNDPL